MDFLFSKEQEILKKSIKDYFTGKITPIIGMDKNKEERLWHERMRKEMANFGLWSLIRPLENRASQFSNLDCVIILEELTRMNPVLGMGVMVHNLFTSSIIDIFGSDEQKKSYLDDLASGKKLGTWLPVEGDIILPPDISGIKAERNNDCWVFNGKEACLYFNSPADLFIIKAVTSLGEAGKHVSSFLVERQTEGLQIIKKEEKKNKKEKIQAIFVFEKAKVPLENMIGSQGEGSVHMVTVQEKINTSVAGFLLGIISASLDFGLNYLKRNELCELCTFNHCFARKRIGEIFSEAEAARLWTYRAAVLEDKGKGGLIISEAAKKQTANLAIQSTAAIMSIIKNCKPNRNCFKGKNNGDQSLSLTDKRNSNVLKWNTIQNFICHLCFQTSFL
ncbi:MAG: acyl-CoA dehydrogenase family protein [Candidatus Aminicenantaceae bacterium]